MKEAGVFGRLNFEETFGETCRFSHGSVAISVDGLRYFGSAEPLIAVPAQKGTAAIAVPPAVRCQARKQQTTLKVVRLVPLDGERPELLVRMRHAHSHCRD